MDMLISARLWAPFKSDEICHKIPTESVRIGLTHMGRMGILSAQLSKTGAPLA